MEEAAGTNISNLYERYNVLYDEVTKVWRILDLKHPEALKLQSYDAEVEDDNKAVTIVTESMFTRLISEAINLGILSPSVAGIGSNIKDVNDLKVEIASLKNQLAQTTTVADAKATESYLLKQQALSVLQRITVAGDIDEITRLR